MFGSESKCFLKFIWIIDCIVILGMSGNMKDFESNKGCRCEDSIQSQGHTTLGKGHRLEEQDLLTGCDWGNIVNLQLFTDDTDDVANDAISTSITLHSKYPATGKCSHSTLNHPVLKLDSLEHPWSTLGAFPEHTNHTNI